MVTILKGLWVSGYCPGLSLGVSVLGFNVWRLHHSRVPSEGPCQLGLRFTFWGLGVLGFSVSGPFQGFSGFRT